MRILCTLALTVAIAACADGAGEADTPRADSVATGASVGASATPAGGAAISASTPTAGPATTAAAGASRSATTASGDVPRVRVTMKEWAMEVSHDTVPAGTVVFDFVNGGTEEHELEVELGDREWEAGEVGPGGKGSMTTTLTPGTWIIYCPLASPSANGSHKIRGQQTTIVVK